MVFFACNSCGTSLKKNQVDKHVYQCRCATVSCMDCQKDFGIKDYVAHTKCISEAEKYGGGDWKAPSNFNKGEKKQQAWVDTVNDTLKTAGNKLSPPCKSLLQLVAKHDNCPRKKPKFLNFIKNITKNKFDFATIENVWNLLEAQWKSQAEIKKQQENSSIPEEIGNGETEEVVPKKKRKKSKQEAKEELQEEMPVEEVETEAPAKKKKKSKQEVEEEPPQEEMAIEEAEIEAPAKKKKKKRKQKELPIEEEETELTEAPAKKLKNEEMPTEEADTEAPAKKKKKKKSKSDE